MWTAFWTGRMIRGRQPKRANRPRYSPRPHEVVLIGFLGGRPVETVLWNTWTSALEPGTASHAWGPVHRSACSCEAIAWADRSSIGWGEYRVKRSTTPPNRRPISLPTWAGSPTTANVQDPVVDQPGHGVPALLFGQPQQLALQFPPTVQVEYAAVGRRRTVERDPFAYRRDGQLEGPLVVRRGDQRSFPASCSVASTCGSVTSRRYRSLVNPCTSMPSATCAAVAVICGPTAAISTGGGPYGFGPGENIGVIKVCW